MANISHRVRDPLLHNVEGVRLPVKLHDVMRWSATQICSCNNEYDDAGGTAGSPPCVSSLATLVGAVTGRTKVRFEVPNAEPTEGGWPIMRAMTGACGAVRTQHQSRNPIPERIMIMASWTFTRGTALCYGRGLRASPTRSGEYRQIIVYSPVKYRGNGPEQ